MVCFVHLLPDNLDHMSLLDFLHNMYGHLTLFYLSTYCIPLFGRWTFFHVCTAEITMYLTVHGVLWRPWYSWIARVRVNIKMTSIQIWSSLLQWTHVTNMQLTKDSMLEGDLVLHRKLPLTSMHVMVVWMEEWRTWANHTCLATLLKWEPKQKNHI